MRLVLMLVLGSVLIISGCATTAKVNSEARIQELQAKIGSLEGELKQQQEENLDMRKQLDEAKVQPIRMPNGKEIQIALKNAGFYSGIVDGDIGPETKEAIKKFQEANKLNPDGVIGSRTWSLLIKYLEVPQLKEEQKPQGE
ncbi:MAG: peptidoglycan-binding protein [Candidatus Omnitrophota bacterium]